MSLVARWGLAIVVSAGAFAVSWWVCQKRAGLDEGTALAVAGAVLAVVLTVAGWWAARERPDRAELAPVAYKSKTVKVEIIQGSLWVGAEAYPLRNIARARTIKLVPNRRAAIGRYVMAIALWVFLGAVAVIAIKVVAVVVVIAVVVVVLVLIAISTIRLIAMLSAQTFYALVIETVGTQRTLLRNADEKVLNSLAQTIMTAIDDPYARIYWEVESF